MSPFARLALKVSADASLRVTKVPVSDLDFNPQNTQGIPPVKIFAILELEQN